MTEEEFAALLAPGYETLPVEFKGPGLRDEPNLFAKVVRAVLGMSNLRRGGLVIIGVSEKDDGSPVAVGLQQDHLRSWGPFDELSEAINLYASPCVDFDFRTQDYQGKSFVVLAVREFQDIPILCCKDHFGGKNQKQILRKGGIYVRARHKRETSEVPSEEEMRELLELAVDKGVVKFVNRALRGGFILPQPLNPAGGSGDAEAEDQGKDLP